MPSDERQPRYMFAKATPKTLRLCCLWRERSARRTSPEARPRGPDLPTIDGPRRTRRSRARHGLEDPAARCRLGTQTGRTGRARQERTAPYGRGREKIARRRPPEAKPETRPAPARRRLDFPTPPPPPPAKMLWQPRRRRRRRRELHQVPTWLPPRIAAAPAWPLGLDTSRCSSKERRPAQREAANKI